MNLNLDEIKEVVQNDIYTLQQKYGQIGHIPEPSIGNLIHIPRIFSIEVDGELKSGHIKDCMYQEDKVPETTFPMIIGYAAASNIKQFQCLPLLIFSQKALESKVGWSANDYHYGDFMYVKEVRDHKDCAGVVVRLGCKAIRVELLPWEKEEFKRTGKYPLNGYEAEET